LSNRSLIEDDEVEERGGLNEELVDYNLKVGVNSNATVDVDVNSMTLQELNLNKDKMELMFDMLDLNKAG